MGLLNTTVTEKLESILFEIALYCEHGEVNFYRPPNTH